MAAQRPGRFSEWDQLLDLQSAAKFGHGTVLGMYGMHGTGFTVIDCYNMLLVGGFNPSDKY